MTREYNTSTLPSSEHYFIDIVYNDEVKRDTYFAVNKETNLPEVPFILFTDCDVVLADLEEMYTDSKPKKKSSAVSHLKPVH